MDRHVGLRLSRDDGFFSYRLLGDLEPSWFIFLIRVISGKKSRWAELHTIGTHGVFSGWNKGCFGASYGYMKNKILFCLAAVWLSVTLSCRWQSGEAQSGEAKWLTDYNTALAQAKAENKKVFIDFTGSDWCGWCIKLDKEIFSTPEFADYAAKNLVLVKADFPRSKPQSAELKAQNAKLQQQFQIQGYPTLIILDAGGKQIGEMGYMDGGPKPFLEKLSQLK